MERKRLWEVLPTQFMRGQFEYCTAMPHAFMEVLETCRAPERPWPGRHRYVSVWYVLSNGKAVGFNENPVRGWSFPVITYPPYQRTGPLARPDDMDDPPPGKD